MIPGAVSVGYIHPGVWSATFGESMLDLFFYDATHNARFTSHPFGKMSKECGSGGIVAGRNKLAELMLTGEAEWLWMVDTDMSFAPDTVERLVESADPIERPIVGGLCFAHKTDGKASFHGTRYRAQPTLYDFLDEPDRVGFAPRFTYEPDALEPVAGTGAACLLIHRSVFEDVRAKYGAVWFDPIVHPTGPTTFSEDLSFCVRAAGCGHSAWVHTGVKTSHHKGGVYLDEQFYIAQRAANEGG